MSTSIHKLVSLPTFGVGYNLPTNRGALPLVVHSIPCTPSVVFMDALLRACEWLRIAQYGGSRQERTQERGPSLNISLNIQDHPSVEFSTNTSQEGARP